MDLSKIVFTGGSGLLGTEFRKLLPGMKFPSSAEFKVTDYEQMRDYIKAGDYELIVHAAAFTSPPLIEKDPERALKVNIIGTCNVVRLCMEFNMRLIYISTDYIFKGDKGNYKEDDPVYPVNKYAWSKLGGECAARMYEKSLIIRTSFGPNVFPYDRAFVDQWTSRESVSTIVKMISKLLDRNLTGVIHVGGERKTVFEYARSQDRSKNIGSLSIHDVNFAVPVDTSLNCNRYAQVIQQSRNAIGGLD
jgi:dTDP-4-dehydrorhamnose reductase